tara:strand:- start:128458 stop:129264 length:807 start_codon:yes stop_codon:yes gene_type:complete
MHNLFRFIKLNQSLLLFIIIESFSVSLFLSNNKYQNSRFFLSINEYTSIAYSYADAITNYIHLKEKNKFLSEENAKLLSLIQRKDHTKFESKNISNDFIYKSAKVINNSINKRNNYLTINKGIAHGIKEGMGVITNKGVIGIVQSSSKNYSIVISLLNNKTSIGIKLKKNNHFGILKWNGYNYKEANINNFPSHIDISLGDTIVTSSYSMIFPENIIIGTVKEINNDEGYYNILIHLFEDFNQLNYAYITESKNIIEKKILEKSIRNE